MKRGPFHFLLGLALTMSVAATFNIASAASMKEVDCSVLDLKYEAPATKVRCLQLDDVGNQTEVKIERIVATNESSELIFTHYASKFRTYLRLTPLQNTIESEGYFSAIENWQTPEKYAGFDISAFNGVQKSGDAPALCAGFARFSGSPGNYEFDNGPGYKNLDDGIYCVFSGNTGLFNPIENFYRVVEDKISKVNIPQ